MRVLAGYTIETRCLLLDSTAFSKTNQVESSGLNRYGVEQLVPTRRLSVIYRSPDQRPATR